MEIKWGLEKRAHSNNQIGRNLTFHSPIVFNCRVDFDKRRRFNQEKNFFLKVELLSN